MKASSQWLASTSAEFRTGFGRWGCAQLKYYTASYREWGEGPPLILVPGLAGGMDLLEPLAHCLAPHFRVIAYQLRGEDDCFALRQRFGLRELVDDLAEFVEWHYLERPAVLGVSFGGALALEFAARYPNRLRGLALQGAGAWFESGVFQRLAGQVLAQYPLPPNNPFINQFFNLLFGRRQPAGPLFDFVTQHCWQTDQSVMAQRFRMVEQFDVSNQLHRIRGPVLVLAGDRDVVVSSRSLQALTQGLGNCRQVKLPNAGHLACVTHADRLASEVSRFFQ